MTVSTAAARNGTQYVRHDLDDALVEREAALNDRRQVRAGHALQVDVWIQRRHRPLVRAGSPPSPASRADRPGRVWLADHRPCAAGRRTPITSTSRPLAARCRSTASTAAALAELHAITSSLAPAATKCSAISIENARSSS